MKIEMETKGTRLYLPSNFQPSPLNGLSVTVGQNQRGIEADRRADRYARIRHRAREPEEKS